MDGSSSMRRRDLTSDAMRIAHGITIRQSRPVQVDMKTAMAPSQPDTPTTFPRISPESEVTVWTDPLVGSSAAVSPLRV